MERDLAPTMNMSAEKRLSLNAVYELQLQTAKRFKDISTKTEQEPAPVRPAPRPLLAASEVAELLSLSRSIPERQRLAAQEGETYQKSLEAFDNKIAELNAEVASLRDSIEELEKLGMGKEIKALNKAKQKYATTLDMHVSVRSLDDEHFVATVKFAAKEESKAVHFTINSRTRSVTAFDVSALMSTEEAEELQKAVSDQQGKIDMQKLVKTVRPMCL